MATSRFYQIASTRYILQWFKPIRSRFFEFCRRWQSFGKKRTRRIASAVTSAMTAMFKQHQVTPTPASVKAVEESCVTCGGAHSYRQCPATDGNTFLGYQDNIQEYVSAAAVNYNNGNTAPFDEPFAAPKPKPSIPYPSRANKQKFREKDDNLALKFVEFFRELHFELSFTNALLHMPKFSSMFKSLLNNKEKLFDLAKTSGMVECLALADRGASINLMPHSVWKKLSLHDLTSTRMTLELADRSITPPISVAKDVFVKVGKFHFLADFVVVDYDTDPWVPLILGRPFLRTARALINVYGE
ncbi:reverse transcriptase domain-containing protein [Tanacetum coccineum]